MENKVVAHLREGRIVKGLTHDFDSRREVFHVLPAEGGGIPVRVRISEMKALFYVRDYIGNREYDPPPGFGVRADRGRRCVVTFYDGEVIFGSTPDYDADGRPSDSDALGFMLYPSDSDDNNVRIFVSSKAIKEIHFPES